MLVWDRRTSSAKGALGRQDLIIERTSEGRALARTRGIKFGKLTPNQRQEALDRRSRGETLVDTLVDIARSYNVSHTTIARLA